VPVRDNAQLVARAAGLSKIAQRPALTPDEARKLLGAHI
jgi:3-keto-5-aminohexanoate cleavage enzyme